MTRVNLRTFFIALALGMFSEASISAKTVVQNPSVVGVNNQMGGQMYIDPVVGYDFIPQRAIELDYLGVYDDASDGLRGPHTAGLFVRQTGQLLATATFNNGSLLENAFRWERVPTVILQPGVVYNIASFNWAEDRIIADYPGVFTFRPDISVTAGYLEWMTPGLHMPTREGGPGAVFIGPAFGSAVPEPTTLTLFSTGCISIIFLRKRQAIASNGRKLS